MHPQKIAPLSPAADEGVRRIEKKQMGILLYIWTIFKNLVALAIFFGMLSVASTSFETVAVSGLALIYATIITYSTIIVRAQFASAFTSTNQFIFLAKLHNDPSKAEEITDLEAVTKEDWSNFQKKNPIYYINMIFIFFIWLVSVVSIVGTL